MRLTARMEGLTPILRKIEGNRLLQEPWRQALDEIARAVQERAQRRAPRQRGALAAGITRRLDARPMPWWALVSLGNVTNRGFRYGGALEGGPMYHYRSGPYKGRQTRHWFKGTIRSVQRAVNRALEGALRRIEQEWRT